MDFKKIEKEINKLGIPKEITIPKISMLDKVTYMVLMSERASAKTTTFLLVGLFLTKMYGVVTQYVRLKREYITVAKIATLYDVVKEFGYINKIFGGEYNDIVYDRFEHTFYLVGDNDKKMACCVCLNLEDAESYKSGYNAPHGDFILFDEFLIRRERIDHPSQFFDVKICISCYRGFHVFEPKIFGYIVSFLFGIRASNHFYIYSCLCFRDDKATLTNVHISQCS